MQNLRSYLVAVILIYWRPRSKTVHVPFENTSPLNFRLLLIRNKAVWCLLWVTSSALRVLLASQEFVCWTGRWRTWWRPTLWASTRSTSTFTAPAGARRTTASRWTARPSWRRRRSSRESPRLVAAWTRTCQSVWQRQSQSASARVFVCWIWGSSCWSGENTAINWEADGDTTPQLFRVSQRDG